MGPLQYMVVVFDRHHFSTELMPELRHLTHKGILRVVDALVVGREADGTVAGRELADVMPGEDTSFHAVHADDASEWFTQDDIDLTATVLPSGSAVLLLLFEHRWAVRLDEAVHDANNAPSPAGVELSAIAAEIEHLLVSGSSPGVSYALPSRPA